MTETRAFIEWLGYLRESKIIRAKIIDNCVPVTEKRYAKLYREMYSELFRN